jgi:tetratricopeptide (TPR) repeat protein
MRRVLENNPDHAQALNYIGYTYAEKEIFLDEAEALVKRALELKPDDGYITDSLGWVYFKKGQLDKAIAELEKAHKLAPEDPVIAEHLGDAYLKNQQGDKAVQMYERSLQLDPKKTEVAEKLKKLHREKKKP